MIDALTNWTLFELVLRATSPLALAILTVLAAWRA